jgi:biopolymer transport protein TolR
MARTFKRQRPAHPVSELNVTNLIDVAFTLLIIFMISAPLLQNEQTIPVNLPEQGKAEQAKPDPTDRFETITVLKDNTVRLGQRTIALPNLRATLAAYANDPKPPVFRIRADRDASGQQIVTVLDALQQNQLTRFTIDTQIKQ